MFFQDTITDSQKQYFTLPILLTESVTPTIAKPVINAPNTHYGVQKFNSIFFYKNISLPLSKENFDKIFQNNDSK